MTSLRKFFGCSLAGLAASLLLASAASASVILSTSMVLTAADSTQLGRLSRNGDISDWSTPEPYPGVVNPTTTYHYKTLDIDLGALQAPLGGYGQYIQIDFDSTSANTFLSAYLDSYNPLDKAANYLGDTGSSGDFFGIDAQFFQIIVPSGHHLVLLLNETTTNGGFNAQGDILVEAFCSTEYDDPSRSCTNVTAAVPEPGSWSLVAVGLIMAAARRRSGKQQLTATVH